MIKPILMSAVILAIVCGCENAEPPSPTSAPATQSSTAKKANCVICGDHEIDVTASTPTQAYEGEAYYFCAAECKAEFAKDPAKWAAAQKARATSRQ